MCLCFIEVCILFCLSLFLWKEKVTIPIAIGIRKTCLCRQAGPIALPIGIGIFPCRRPAKAVGVQSIEVKKALIYVTCFPFL